MTTAFSVIAVVGTRDAGLVKCDGFDFDFKFINQGVKCTAQNRITFSVDDNRNRTALTGDKKWWKCVANKRCNDYSIAAKEAADEFIDLDDNPRKYLIGGGNGASSGPSTRGAGRGFTRGRRTFGKNVGANTGTSAGVGANGTAAPATSTDAGADSAISDSILSGETK